MTKSLFAMTINTLWRSLLYWSIGVTAYASMIVALYPSIAKNPGIEEYIENLPEALRAFFGVSNILTPEGFLTAELFSLIVPVLFLIFAIGKGADLIAGEEERKTMDLLLANPVSRGKVVAHKSLAMAAVILALGAVLWAGIVASAAAVGMDLEAGKAAAASLNISLLGLLFGSLSLAVGCLSGRKSIASGVSAAAASGTYLLYGLAPLIDWLDDYRFFSPFFYALGGDPLVNGFDPEHITFFIVATLVTVAFAHRAFERRDIST